MTPELKARVINVALKAIMAQMARMTSQRRHAIRLRGAVDCWEGFSGAFGQLLCVLAAGARLPLFRGWRTAMSQPLACAGIAAAVLTLAGCANPPVQYYAHAAPVGYTYSETFGYIHGPYAPDGVYVGTGLTPSSQMGVQPYVIPPPAPSSRKSPQQTQPLPPQSLPDRGAAVFGPGGIAGTVASNNGSFATVAPQGGGSPGILTPQGNGIGLLSVPGQAPSIVVTRP
jgi:hypothetical protein